MNLIVSFPSEAITKTNAYLFLVLRRFVFPGLFFFRKQWITNSCSEPGREGGRFTGFPVLSVGGPERVFRFFRFPPNGVFRVFGFRRSSKWVHSGFRVSRFPAVSPNGFPGFPVSVFSVYGQMGLPNGVSVFLVSLFGPCGFSIFPNGAFIVIPGYRETGFRFSGLRNGVFGFPVSAPVAKRIPRFPVSTVIGSGGWGQTSFRCFSSPVRAIWGISVYRFPRSRQTGFPIFRFPGFCIKRVPNDSFRFSRFQL